MELKNLHTIVEGLESLSAIEKEHPVLGKKLFDFVNEVSSCCEIAYNRLSRALGNVRNLSTKSSESEINDVVKQITKVPDSEWFKEVAGICDQLAALADRYESDFNSQLGYTSSFGENWQDSQGKMDTVRYSSHYKIAPLFSLLQKHERQLKDDIRYVVSNIQTKLAHSKEKGNYDELRNYAQQVQSEISYNIDEIKKISYQIKGTSEEGISAILTPEKVAEKALQKPERVLIFNMLFVLIALLIGATVFQYLSVYQFILVTGFAITVVIVLNAFYLRTIDKLSEEGFLKLIQLAVLKFFAPLRNKQ